MTLQKQVDAEFATFSKGGDSPVRIADSPSVGSFSWNTLVDQIISPAQLLPSSSNEGEFHGSDQFQLKHSNDSGDTMITLPTAVIGNINSATYFNTQNSKKYQQNDSNALYINIPAESSDNIKKFSEATKENADKTRHDPLQQQKENNGRGSLDLLYSQENQQITNIDGSVLLKHHDEQFIGARLFNQNSIASVTMQPLYSSNSSTVNPPAVTTNNYMHDKFTAMLLSNGISFSTEANLSSSANSSNSSISTKQKANQKQKQQQHKKSSSSSLVNKHFLSHQLSSKHNVEHDLLLNSLTKKKLRQQTPSKTIVKILPIVSKPGTNKSNQDEEPLLEDGSNSCSTTSSISEYSTCYYPKDDRRQRNTAASVRFRIKKKMKEEELQKAASDMTSKAKHMEQRVHELEREIKWLKALVVKKNEDRLVLS